MADAASSGSGSRPIPPGALCGITSVSLSRHSRLVYYFAKENAAWLRAVDFTLLPKRPFWMSLPVVGMSEVEYRVRALRRLSGLAFSADRLLTPEEKESIFPTIGAVELNVGSATPCCLLLAGWLAWKGRRTYRFPLYSPTFIRFHPGRFPIAHRWAPVQGPLAHGAWHATRLACYLWAAVPAVLIVNITQHCWKTERCLESSPELRRLAEDRRAASQRMRTRNDTAAVVDCLEKRYEDMFPETRMLSTDEKGLSRRTLLPKSVYFCNEILQQLSKQSTGRFTMEQDDGQLGANDWSQRSHVP